MYRNFRISSTTQISSKKDLKLAYKPHLGGTNPVTTDTKLYAYYEAAYCVRVEPAKIWPHSISHHFKIQSSSDKPRGVYAAGTLSL